MVITVGERVVVYGAGRTGIAIAGAIRGQGFDVLIAGRDGNRVEAAARAVGLQSAVSAVTDPAGLDQLARGSLAVVNTAGPLAHSAPPLIEAAVRNRVHYLDIANEPEALQAAFSLHDVARDRGVCLVSGLGFGVAASEWAALEAASKVGALRSLEVVFAPASQGTSTPAATRTKIETITRPARQVEHGRLLRVRLGGGARRTILPDGSRTTTVPIFSGDLLALHRCLRSESIIVRTPVNMPPWAARLALLTLVPLLRRPAVADRVSRPRPRRPGPRPAGREPAASFVSATAAGDHASTATVTIRVQDTSELMSALITHTLRNLSLATDLPAAGASTPVNAIGGPTLGQLLRS